MKFKISTLFIAVFCITYALYFCFLDSAIFKDRTSYSGYYANISDIILNSAYQTSFLKLLTEEPLFLIINIFFTKFILINNETLPYIYVFFICFTFSFCILKNSINFLFSILGILMLITVSVSLHAQLVVLRQSLATCILLIAICYHIGLNKLLLISFFCALIHNSFFILFLFLFLFKTFNSKGSLNRLLLISFFISVVSSISFYFISNYLSIRQINHLTHEVNSSGAGFILWGGCLILILLKVGKNKNISLIDAISIFGLSFYILNYYFLPIGGRLLITFIPFIFISLTSNIHKKRIIPVILIFNILFICANIYKLNENLINNSLNEGYQIYNFIGL